MLFPIVLSYFIVFFATISRNILLVLQYNTIGYKYFEDRES